MTEIIHDLTVEETKDGYRIEIKGDKEKIRAYVASLGERAEWPRWYARRRFESGGASDRHRDQWMVALATCQPWSVEKAE